MNDLQDKNLLDKAYDKLKEWKKKPLNVFGTPENWTMICTWVEYFLNELKMEEK